MKDTKHINFGLKTGIFLVLFLGLSLNYFGSEKTNKVFLNTSQSKGFQKILNDVNHASFISLLDSEKENLFFELEQEEDDDDDTKNYLLVNDLFSKIKAGRFDIASDRIYLNATFYHNKTPRYILYRNFKDFLI